MSNAKRVVDSYLSMHKKRAEKERSWFQTQLSLKEVIRVAALAQSDQGKRLDHQRRIKGAVLEDSYKALLEKIDDIESCSSFDELIDLIAVTIRPIHGIGELAVYDTALRIGAYLDLFPDKVYLHAGTRTGARNLGLDIDRPCIPLSEFPREFQELSAEHIEDVLCIYKKRLWRLPQAKN